MVLNLVGASLSEPQPYEENSAVVSARTIAANNGIATHYCSFGRVVHILTNTINLQILPYKCIASNAKIFDFIYNPYKADTVNHATKMKWQEFLIFHIRHVTKNEMAILLIYFGHMTQIQSERRG